MAEEVMDGIRSLLTRAATEHSHTDDETPRGSLLARCSDCLVQLDTPGDAHPSYLPGITV